MTTKSFFGISLSNSQERLFWFSRAGRLLFLGYFAYAAYTMAVSDNNFASRVLSILNPRFMGYQFPMDYSFSTLGYLALNTASSLLLCWWYWLVARLFKLCETGMVFSESSLSLLQKIGKLFLFFAAFGLFNQILSHFIMGSTVPALPGPELAESLAVHVTYIGFGMFGLQFNGINLEPIAVALMIFIAIGVIDEGRKVREEQELTV
ncbi:MAG: DUF2975 domain-containing protein [Verrucomicrobia bacterium]|nr:DUF2975 domain-containing protein [Verrucomicrobiota bacterium]